QLVRKFLIRKGSRLGIIEVYSDPVPASVEVEVEGKRKPISNLFAAQTTQTVRLYDYLEASGAKVLGYIPYSEDEQLNMHFSILEQIPEESRRWQKAKLPTWHERDMAHD
ncbi:MAG: hypothetical protein ACE5DQ_01950, partial [Candidatus Paceibacterota bacterium]